MNEVFRQRLLTLVRVYGNRARFAKAAGIDFNTVKGWLNGATPNTKTINKIAAKLNIDPGWFMGIVTETTQAKNESTQISTTAHCLVQTSTDEELATRIITLYILLKQKFEESNLPLTECPSPNGLILAITNLICNSSSKGFASLSRNSMNY